MYGHEKKNKANTTLDLDITVGSKPPFTAGF